MPFSCFLTKQFQPKKYIRDEKRVQFPIFSVAYSSTYAYRSIGTGLDSGEHHAQHNLFVLNDFELRSHQRFSLVQSPQTLPSFLSALFFFQI